jgi:hypothetical protein
MFCSTSSTWGFQVLQLDKKGASSHICLSNCRLVTPTPPDPRREALPVRMSMVEVERALEHVAAAEEAAAAAPGAAGPVDEGAVEAREQQGLFAYRLAVVSGWPAVDCLHVLLACLLLLMTCA